ncbi:MAG: prepilin peptidase [Gammaproteobacteria bacterium]|nr:prepilin peptidase [Gammaproteobacteria bacterium]
MATNLTYWLSTPLGAGFIVLLGLILGSFVNVLITRLPLMVAHDERQLSLRQLAIEPPVVQTISLFWPPSFCPSCRTAIRWRHAIPIFSWLWLRGRCAHCEQPISVRYPIVEGLCALMLFALYTSYGPTFEFCFKVFFCFMLVAIAYMDWETGWLPDVMTIPLIGGGLLYSVLAQANLTDLGPSDAIIGALAGYSLFWLLNYVYRTLTGRNGMGFGDFKLIAALGAWLGWMLLPLALLFAALIALLFGIVMAMTGRYQSEIGIRFAPFLALAGIGLLLSKDLHLLPAYIAL